MNSGKRNAISTHLDPPLDSLIFGGESHADLQKHDIHWPNHTAHGLPESDGYRYNAPENGGAASFLLPAQNALPESHEIGLLTRGPHGQVALDSSRPTYVFFHGKTDSGFAKINAHNGQLNSYRREFIHAFPADANVVIVNMDREHRPGKDSFSRQYEALTNRFCELGLTHNLHLYGESMGAADVTGFSIALLEKKVATDSQTLTLVSGFDELANPAADMAFNAVGSAGTALRPYVGTSVARGVIGMDRTLNNLANLSRMKELGFNGKIHVAITQEEAPKVNRQPDHTVATPYQERMYDHAVALFGESHVSRSDWEHQHTNYPSAQVVKASIALMQSTMPNRDAPAK